MRHLPPNQYETLNKNLPKDVNRCDVIRYEESRGGLGFLYHAILRDGDKVLAYSSLTQIKARETKKDDL